MLLAADPTTEHADYRRHATARSVTCSPAQIRYRCEHAQECIGRSRTQQDEHLGPHIKTSTCDPAHASSSHLLVHQSIATHCTGRVYAEVADTSSEHLRSRADVVAHLRFKAARTTSDGRPSAQNRNTCPNFSAYFWFQSVSSCSTDALPA